MRLHVHKHTTVRLPRRRLLDLFAILTEGEARIGRPGGVNLVFTTDHHMRSLNRRYRGLDRSTDVLAFNFGEHDADDDVYGEIYISVPMAMRQAREYGVTSAEELLRLTCHGLLHLFGYDHETTREAAAMKRREEHFLARVTG